MGKRPLDHLQRFVVPIVIDVNSDKNDITIDQVREHVAATLSDVLNKDLPDFLDRDPTNPMPFVFAGTAVVWDTAGELESDGAVSVLARLNCEEYAALTLALRFLEDDLPLANANVDLYTLEGEEGLVTTRNTIRSLAYKVGVNIPA